uniref:F-box domain-containing protein n=1 Tax=Opuntia streptacantha TaxID=393608 RepID=A0A7C9E974_OPUST
MASFVKDGCDQKESIVHQRKREVIYIDDNSCFDDGFDHKENITHQRPREIIYIYDDSSVKYSFDQTKNVTQQRKREVINIYDDSSINDGLDRRKTIYQQRKRKGGKNTVDLISSMADDILIQILSLLDLKEAVRTSVLSMRWRHVWTNLPDIYDFDTSGMLWLSLKSYDNNQYNTELHKFLDYVNQVLSSTHSTRNNIDRFIVHCPLDINHRDDVQTWVDFAMEKGVKELELHLVRFWCEPLWLSPVYLDPFGRYAQSPSAKTLVSVSLTGLKLGYCFLISVLFNLPNLERLSMRYLGCGCGNDISVEGPSLKLKYLEIFYCHGLKCVSISASKLNSFEFCGRDEDIDFISVPLLNEVSFTGAYTTRLIRDFKPILGFSSQLTKLTLNINYNTEGIFARSVGFPHFRKLKQLEVTTSCESDHSLLVFTCLLEACPVLHKFKLERKVNDYVMSMGAGWQLIRDVNRSIDRVSSKVHHGLNTFEMVGFMGGEVDKELVLHLARFAIVLEK